MKTKIITIFVVFMLFCTLMSSVLAVQERGSRLVDDADLLTASEETKILTRLDEISEKHEFDVVILTEKTIGKSSVADYADDYYDYNGYGYGNDYTGLLLLITFDEDGGIWYISTCGDAIDAFDSFDIESIGESMKSDLSSENYADAFEVFITECDYYIDGYLNGFPFDFTANIIISVVVGFIIAFISVSVMKSKLKSVSMQRNAANYVKNGSMVINTSRDFYLYRIVNRTVKPKDTRSGTHISSSGRSHGGGGGRF